MSTSVILFLFSITFLLGSISLKSYINLDTQSRDFIVILCSINLFFSTIYFLNAIRLERIFKLENKIIINYGKKLGLLTLFYLPHLFLFSSLLMRNLHNLELLMVFLIIFMEVMLIGLVFKEVYDLLFHTESQRDFELDKNRKKYIEKE